MCQCIDIYWNSREAKTSVVTWHLTAASKDTENQRWAWNALCLRTRKFSKTDGHISKLGRGWRNRLLLATFFFLEWWERVNGKIIKSSLFLLPVTKCNTDLNRNISGSFETCCGIRHSHDLKVAPSPFLFANYSRERLLSQGRYMMDFMSPDDETQHH